MEDEKFIKEQLEMIENDFSLSQIREEVYRYIFQKYIGVATINKLIDMCMELYSEIVKRNLLKK